MSSDKQVSTYLEDEDYELFKKAKDLYGIGTSKLVKEILHSWLFANQLQILSGKKRKQ